MKKSDEWLSQSSEQLPETRIPMQMRALEKCRAHKLCMGILLSLSIPWLLLLTSFLLRTGKALNLNGTSSLDKTLPYNIITLYLYPLSGLVSLKLERILVHQKQLILVCFFAKLKHPKKFCLKLLTMTDFTHKDAPQIM